MADRPMDQDNDVIADADDEQITGVGDDEFEDDEDMEDDEDALDADEE